MALQRAALERFKLHSYVTEQRHLDDIDAALIVLSRHAGTANTPSVGGFG